MSLNRLISLAQRTGDRLIVHDPINGRDIVLMGIGAYEELLDKAEDVDNEINPWDDDHDSPWSGATGQMSGAETWNRAGDVLADRYDDFSDSTPDVSDFSFGSQSNQRSTTIPDSRFQIPDSSLNDWDESDESSLGDARVEMGEFATAAEPVHNEQPLAPQTDDGNEPIFYEEPVV
ncbi:MAG: hypothetical protein AAB408_00330 [Patescibacteria group bacterium]